MYRPSVHTPESFSYPARPQFQTAAVPSQFKRALSSDRFVPQLFSDQAKQNPGRVAVVHDSIQVTYGELDDRSNRLAQQLKAAGIVADSVVAVCMRRSPLSVIASLAVLKAGAAYLPLDPNYPRERLSYILTDANTPLVLSDSSMADRLPEGSWRLILLDREDLTGKTGTDWQTSQICPDHLAYVIYTSGSTGKPKGVEITHKNLLNLVSWHQRAFTVTPDDRMTQFVSFGFDASVSELWPHLTAGAAVHIVPEEARSSPELLKDWLIDQEITIAFVPTGIAERLIVLNWPAATTLRLLLTGADTLHHYPRPELPFALINNYGPTEAAVMSTSGRVATQRQDSEQRPPIGRAIDGAEIYVVDELLNPVPHGEVGELCIGGAGVGRGYRNSPELTAKKFVPDPFGNRPGTRLYRTGDLARWLPDGQIEYVGRVDDLMKIRGYRIEPNEIISVLNTHPTVEASAVTQQKDGTDNQRLVAYIVVKQAQARPTATELRDLLRSRLPDYMVPAMFVVLADLPITPNGKVDRAALPPPDPSTILPGDNYVSPRTVLEEKLSALVANLLGLSQVGIHDNFFLIGGHSLFGTQLIAQIRENFGVELSLRSVFESPTPALLAKEIECLMVNKIGAMSDDEVQHVLEQETSSRG